MRPINRAVAACAVLAMCAAACGDPDSISGPPAPTESVPSTESVDTTASADTILPGPATAPPVTLADGVDPADAYLDATTEIYSRTLPDGHEFVARLSNGSYADLFGYSWTAPTGSAELCLGDHALLIGVPGVVGWWGSAWTSSKWFNDILSTQPLTVQSTMEIGDNSPAGTYLVLRTDTDSSEVILLSSVGTEIDRAPLVNGLAVVVMPPDAWQDGGSILDLAAQLVGVDGQSSAPTQLSYGDQTYPAECGPGEAPVRTLPTAGAQPADASTAEAQIRERYALLVDQTIPSDEKPTDLLDDDTGVDSAVATLNQGQYADDAANAIYTVDELVFTSPTEAWFLYTITTPASTFPGRFGQATFNGSVWQTTRATLCQDLSLAQAPCHPNPDSVVPIDPDFDAALAEWNSRAMLYPSGDGCPPLSQC